jgi:DNA repair photolyase
MWYTERLSTPGAIKGRGTPQNPAGRFETHIVEPTDDGWAEAPPEGPTTVATTVQLEHSRSIITTNDSPDVPFDASINPYKGCEHGCVYCFARPTHAYLGMSPGLDFETKIIAKPDAAALLRRAFARGSYQPRPIALGANTDAYQPVERELRITRGILEVLHEHHHPVGILTKSELCLRDTDLLADMAARRLCHVYLSITTLDPELARRLEPRAASPHRRLRTLERLSAAGIPTGVLASPMIPGLNDHELERILAASADAGAARAGTIVIRLPHELKELFEGWLDAHHPLKKERVLGLIRDCRGGALYDSRPGHRMRGTGPYAALLRRRFEVAAARHGLSRAGYPFDTTAFVRPRDNPRQLQLF